MANQNQGRRAPITLAEADKILDDYRETLRHRTRQFQLIVGLANGAGFAAVSAKVLDALALPATQGAPVVAMIFPSAALFALGLANVGVSACADVVSAEHLVRRGQSVRNHLANGGTAAIRISDVDVGAPLRWHMLEVLGGVFFMAGISYPLLVLALRYVTAGGFTW